MGCENLRYMQYLAALASSLSFTCIKMAISWTSPALPLLKSGNSPVPKITTAEASWISSITFLGALPGYLIAGPLADKFGRRKTLLWILLPSCIPWIIIAYSNSVLMLCFGRFLLGLLAAISCSCCSIYVGEVSDEDIRGKATTMMTLMETCTNVLIFGIGPFLPYTWLGLGCAMIPFASFGLFVFMPESPYYLAKLGQIDETTVSIKALSVKNTPPKELYVKTDAIFRFMDENSKKKSTIGELYKGKYRFSLIIMFGLETLRIFSGGVIINSYLQTIVQESGSSLSPQLTSVICGIVVLPAVLLLTALIDRLGRKPLLITSCLGCGIGLFCEGYYFYVKNKTDTDVSDISWLPAAALIEYLVFRNLGLMAVPVILLGELFASNIKGVAVSVATFYGGILNFLLLKFFPSVSETLGMHLSFFVFGTVCFLGIIFSYFVMPETKNKTLADIQIKLNRKWVRTELVETFQISHL